MSKKAAIIVGEDLGKEYELRVAPAHRTPNKELGFIRSLDTRC